MQAPLAIIGLPDACSIVGTGCTPIRSLLGLAALLVFLALLG